VTSALILVAASGLAREALEITRTGDAYDVIGFVDDDPALWGEVIDDVKVLGAPEVVHDLPDAAVLLCAGSGVARASLAARLRLPDVRYARVVAPAIDVPPSCSVGAGSIVLAGCVLTTTVSLGRHVVSMPNVVFTHDDVVEDFATLCAGVVLGGSVRVRSGAYVGMNASIREHRTIGRESVVGMGSVVLGDVPDRQIWYGVPARERRTGTGTVRT
jgi:sugar O-acyltransferase (sialic acid O-acetyltransferase NeuD family)